MVRSEENEWVSAFVLSVYHKGSEYTTSIGMRTLMTRHINEWKLLQQGLANWSKIFQVHQFNYQVIIVFSQSNVSTSRYFPSSCICSQRCRYFIILFYSFYIVTIDHLFLTIVSSFVVTVTPKFRVAVVGGGPSGSCAAEAIAKNPNIECTLFERKLDNAKPCGGAIPVCMIEEFGLPSQIIDRKVWRNVAFI